ncbi:hypothetical protein SK854_17635 [Lentzea sp. BCCO 10_0061]|uniref:Uncharacterized protein n=1 Tax=Lentzea sokolovensis TaxID=3095429 RepID=A0ABU4UZ62_9PSEU|nr:hypothetical protein [Lentzea sp. BCCO 10_0061]MDX8143945.1 hypothetical protein [Lentzea sp. BCCO 10_0061]
MKNFLGVGRNTDLPDDVRFLTSVTQLIRKRIDQGEVSEQSPAIFFLHPQPLDLSGSRETSQVWMLDNGLRGVSGRMWFVNKTASNGTAVHLDPDEDDEQLLQLAVNELEAGHVPAVVFDARTPTPETRYYPEGLANADNFRFIKVFGNLITLEEVFVVIDRLYEQQLCTPNVQQKAMALWEKADKHFTSSKAEDLIQGVLRAGLTGHFPGCDVKAEQPQASGRLDIEIEEASPFDRSQITRHVVLELKVLRDFGSTGASVSDRENDDWTRSGVEQAATYRDERGTRLAALCCFDMRVEYTGDSCFDNVRDLAARLSVELRSWHIFASSKAYRRAKVS